MKSRGEVYRSQAQTLLFVYKSDLVDILQPLTCILTEIINFMLIMYLLKNAQGRHHTRPCGYETCSVPVPALRQL